MGDFNAIMHAGNKSGGDTSWPQYQDDFKNCITQFELLQAPYTGLKYSWHNGQHGSQTIQKKLDWPLSPPLGNFYYVSGNPMYQLTTKLRRLKIDLKMFHRQNTSNIIGRVGNAKAKWDATQLDLDRNPASETAKTIKRTSAMQYQQLFKDEESYFKQKSRVQWLHLGDRNTSFFHKSLLHRQVRNRTHSLQDDKELGRMTSSYFENLLCAPHLPVTEELNPIFPNTITEASAVAALLPITDDDIQAVLFSIPDTKAPGPDGYNALFFKKSWDVIKYDFIAAIKYFFSNNSLPRCVNATRVALVPKQEHPVCLNDFRPISCCNVLDKCIAKLLVIQLKAALVDVIGPS
ncbi:hypothetical protein NC653_026707 [Populus alba x Populus x berolinensis]|uniref:Reverse transcriptase n=1 Tax=Populus alba x Populus x berolinensis TaxID=444605 RepID=A0AAD6M6D9_9ROSI|nr:hypothetical protein NC653_026707 [Populus alba x Populus x berolinensis]